MKAFSEVFPDPNRLPMQKEIADEVLSTLLDAVIEAIQHVPLRDGKPENASCVRALSRTRRRGFDGKAFTFKTGPLRKMCQE